MGVIEFLTLWIKDIAIVFVIISIIEIMLPNTNMKKYINMIIGFLIIIVIISPFVRLLTNDLNLKKEINKDFKDNVSIYNEENLEFISTQENQIEEVYLEKLKKEIKNLVHGNTKYNVSDVEIDITKDDIEYRKIKSIELIIEEEIQEDVEEELISIKNIEKVSIGEQDGRVVNLGKLEELEDGEEIKNIISKSYNVSKENIKLYIKTSKEEE